jgi:signal transduction histidine kinase
VGVTLSYVGDLVTLDVRDDGVGVSPPAAGNGAGDSAGFGLLAMRQRVERLGGRLAVESDPGGGTAVSAAIPAAPEDPVS